VAVKQIRHDRGTATRRLGDAHEIGLAGARSAKLALALGMVVLAAAIALVLSQSPLAVVGTNSVPPPNATGFIRGGKSHCVSGGTIPQGTTAIRIPFEANVGPKVDVKVLSGVRVLTTGSRAAGWGVTDNVTVAVSRVAQTLSGAAVCITTGPVNPYLLASSTIVASTSPTGQEARAESLHLEYLRPTGATWWSRASSIAHQMGLGRAASGTWIVFLLLALMIAVVLLASWLALGRIAMPRTAWLCALIACLNAVCWSIVTPPFQVPDEQSHFAYTQQLAENHRLPVSTELGYSPEENVVIDDLHQREIRRHPESRTISTDGEQQRLSEDLAEHPSRHGTGGVGGSAPDPPLYYLLEIVPYELGSPGTLLDQLALMRLMSALMAGLTALFAFLFIRETLPGVPWAWTVGGLGVALSPLLGFMSGAVNPDAMLFAVSAAILYCLARAFRRGLTRNLALAIGVLSAVGLLTKVNFIGLLPGVILGLALLTVRASRTGRRDAVRNLGLALAIAASPACVYILIQLVSHRPAFGVVSETLRLGTVQSSVFGAISYVWQFYLPHLPGMSNQFPGLSIPRQVWFDKAVGLYGWLDTSFPPWVDTVALVPAALIALLCVRTVLARRDAVRRRVAEVVVYAAITVGLLVLIAASNFFAPREFLAFAEPRYLLPLLPLLGVLLALAARGAGRHWGPAVGVLVVVLVLGHDIFSQLLVVARFYG
jgi:hypothetical protein